MKSHNPFVAAAVLFAMIAPAANAQPLFADRKVISNHAARELVDACMAFAEAENGTGLAVAVVDPSGNLLSFQAMEDTTETGSLTAQLKAKTAARWRRATGDLFDRVNQHANRAPEWVGDFPQPGGFPLFLNGQMVGAVGAGGNAGDLDDRCALHAIETVFGDMVSTERAP